MQLKLFRHLWGVPDPWASSFPRFHAKGYHGIECPVPDKPDRKRFQTLLARHGFDYIADIFTAGASVADHVASFRDQLRAAAALSPRLVNCHGGVDGWSEAQADEFFGAVLEIEAASGLAVSHETHRGRILYNPWAAARLLERFPRLKLCCDFSHWVCVCERLLGTEKAILQASAERCLHVHARVGYEEGPQVPDPRALEYAEHLKAHEGWWDQVWASQKKRGFKISTLTPEFGPPRYLHTLPHTDQPVADLETICDWQAKRQVERFKAGLWRT
jgi:hypothetical protein